MKGFTAVQEVLFLWGVSFATIVITFVIVPGYAKLAATVTFLYLPLLAMRVRGEDYRDYGITFRHWRKDLALAGIALAVLIPPFILAFVGYAEVLRYLPPAWSRYLSPLTGVPSFHFRLPLRFTEWTIDQLFVVALPEEFFYRGYLQTRLRDAWPHGKVIFGVRIGPAFLLTAVLFALGHLAIFQAWRLAVFFPALLFGWLRERTGTVVGSTLVHAICNLLELVLEASFFGRI